MASQLTDPAFVLGCNVPQKGSEGKRETKTNYTRMPRWPIAGCNPGGGSISQVAKLGLGGQAMWHRTPETVVPRVNAALENVAFHSGNELCVLVFVSGLKETPWGGTMAHVRGRR